MFQCLVVGPYGDLSDVFVLNKFKRLILLWSISTLQQCMQFCTAILHCSSAMQFCNALLHFVLNEFKRLILLCSISTLQQCMQFCTAIL